MRKNKKIFIALSAAAMLSLTACGDTPSTVTTSGTTDTTTPAVSSSTESTASDTDDSVSTSSQIAPTTKEQLTISPTSPMSEAGQVSTEQ